MAAVEHEYVWSGIWSERLLGGGEAKGIATSAEHTGADGGRREPKAAAQG